MKVTELDERVIQDIGHAFGYYDYSPEHGLVCVREPYQGQGYMRRIMDMAFQEGDRLGVPVLLETDAKSKCDKYIHLGMQLAGMRRFGEHGVLYDLIRYPAGNATETERGQQGWTTLSARSKSARHPQRGRRAGAYFSL